MSSNSTDGTASSAGGSATAAAAGTRCRGLDAHRGLQVGQWLEALEFRDLAFVGTDEFLRKNPRESTRAFLGEDRVQVAIHLPVLQAIEEPEPGPRPAFPAKCADEFVRLEAIREFRARRLHRADHCFLVIKEVAADFRRGVARAEVLACPPDEQLPQQIADVFRQLQRIVVPRQDGGLVQPERRLEIAPAAHHLCDAFDKRLENLSRVLHHFRRIDVGLQVRARQPKAVEETVEQIVCRDFHTGRREVRLGAPVRHRAARGFCRGVEYRRRCRHAFTQPCGGGRRRIAFEQPRKVVTVGQFLFVEHLHARSQRFLRDHHSDRLGHRGLRAFQRHRDAFAAVDRHGEFEVTHTQVVAVEQAPRIALAERFAFAIDKDTVR